MHKYEYEKMSIDIRNLANCNDLLVSSVVVPLNIKEADVTVSPFDPVKSTTGEEYFNLKFD